MASEERRTTIAVASGKGGTGKTTVATGLATVASEEGMHVRLLDCDVEAPNAHLFLKPKVTTSGAATVLVPEVDESKCSECGKCGQICQYSAIVSLKTKPLCFPELCHGCGGCAAVCPTGAITEVAREIGRIDEGQADGVSYRGGTLNIGEAMAPPLIRQVRKPVTPEGITIIDAPPGAACPAVSAVHGADLVVLVAEPTPFGLNDLVIAVETVRKLRLDYCVVLNRAAPGRTAVRDWCGDNGVDVVAEIADDRKAAEVYSRGSSVVREVPHVRESIRRALAALLERTRP